MEELTVVMIEPGKKPYIAKIKNDTDYFEDIVNGPVDVAQFLWSGYRIVCNVEALYNRTNSTLPEGTSFIVKYSDDFGSMTTDEAKNLITKLDEVKSKKKKGILSFFFKQT